MSYSIFPGPGDQSYTSAFSVVSLVVEAKAPPEVITLLTDRCYVEAQAEVAARDTLIACQATWRADHDDLEELDAALGQAVEALYLSARIKGGAPLQQTVRTLWGGEAPSDLLGLPLSSQIPRVNEMIQRIDADPDGFGLPKERVEAVREANARLEAKYRAERASRAAWSFQSKAAEEAEEAFRAAYRALVTIIVATYGEVVATQWLPTFERKPRAKKAATTAE
ncbi:MAG: hypothetical protein RIT28_3903 [Pseudomonadota bacterium]